MKQRFRSILATARAGTMAVMMASSAMCQNSPAPVTNAQAQAFINHLQWKSPPYTQWDTNGNLTSVYLKSDEATDTNLALICTVESIKQLIMQTRSHGSNGLTAAGISCLGRLTNLTTLNVACTFKMPDGMFEEICKLQGLRSLGLVGAFPSKESEYENLECLTNLEELRITYCTNFGSQELGLLTNLTRLKKLELNLFDGHSSDTNVLGCLKNLTNLQVWFVHR